MADYQAPVRDMRFVLDELFEDEDVWSLPGYQDLRDGMLDAVLEEAGKFCSRVLQPLNRSGDEEGCEYGQSDTN